jgi:hypothetical protein
MQVTELDIVWKIFVHVDRNVMASSDEVVRAMSFLFRLNTEDQWRQPSPLCKEDVGLRLGKDMQQILPLWLYANCKEFLQQRCMSHMNLIMRYVAGKLMVSGAASVCTLQVKPHLMFRFQWPLVNTLSVKFPPFKMFVTLLSKCTSLKGKLKYWFHSHQLHTYFNFIMLVVCSPDVSRICNIKNNLAKITHHCTSDAYAFTWLGGLHNLWIFLEMP